MSTEEKNTNGQPLQNAAPAKAAQPVVSAASAPAARKGDGALGHFVKAIVFFVLMCGVVVISLFAGIFDGIGDVFNLLHINGTVIMKLLIMIAFVTFISQFILAVLKAFRKSGGRAATLSTVLTSLVKYAAVLLGFCWGLSIIGVNVSTIFASVGIMALIVGFGAESLIADCVTGVFMLFENQYNVGDIVDIDGFRGTVLDIGIRTISIVDGGGNVKIINNSNAKNIINRSNQQSVSICDIAVSYDEDLEQLEEKIPEILKQIREKHSDVFVSEIMYSGVEQLGDSSVTLRFKAPVKEQDVFQGKRILNRELKVAFDKEKVSIPFPQMDVHMK